MNHHTLIIRLVWAPWQRQAPAALKYVHALDDYAVHGYFKR